MNTTRLCWLVNTSISTWHTMQAFIASSARRCLTSYQIIWFVMQEPGATTCFNK
jgi:hypothetical protein